MARKSGLVPLCNGKEKKVTKSSCHAMVNALQCSILAVLACGNKPYIYIYIHKLIYNSTQLYKVKGVQYAGFHLPTTLQKSKL